MLPEKFSWNGSLEEYAARAVTVERILSREHTTRVPVE